MTRKSQLEVLAGMRLKDIGEGDLGGESEFNLEKTKEL
jgi:hypothetical protein